MPRFFRHELRTTDVTAARRFYGELFGELGDIVGLPAEAVARGAVPHWLGHIGVDDVDVMADAFVARGAMRLGPTRTGVDGGKVAVVRDPGSAVVALATAPVSPPRHDVVWQSLHTPTLARSAASYGALFGWQLGEPRDLGELGVHQPFAWQQGGPVAGVMSDISRRPEVHPHWLFHFQVAALAPAIARVRAAGGKVIDVVLPDGQHIAVCDDPQGAAFALCERVPALA